jgi:hypothetical protein
MKILRGKLIKLFQILMHLFFNRFAYWLQYNWLWWFDNQKIRSI